MSALTDLFTALANKIRSKTGTATTYTPPQMVSSGIDDVYNAGVAAGTPTLTGDAAAGNVLSGKTFYNTSTTKQTGSMTNIGAVSQALNCGGSYTVPAGYHNGSGTVTANSLASQTGVDSGKTAIDASHVHSGYQGWVNGSKVSGSYTAPTINSITPSNSSPVSISSGNNYTPTASGKVISSYTDFQAGLAFSELSKDSIYAIRGQKAYAVYDYQSVTPSSSGQGVTTGAYYVNGNGWLYSTKPTGGFTETSLWTNSSPTSTFAAQTVSLNQTITTTKFDYIKIKVRVSTSVSTEQSYIFPTSEFLNFADSGSNMPRGYVGMRINSNQARFVTMTSTSQVKFSASYQLASTSSNSTGIIPVSISGLKFTP